MANEILANEVLANKYDSILTTSKTLSDYMTVDNSLASEVGTKKKITRRTVSGSVQDLAMGEGNTTAIEVELSQEEYEVGLTQGRFVYYDEEAMQDANVVDTGIKGLSETMVNDFVTKAIAEFDKAALEQGYTYTSGSADIDFDTVADAIAKFNTEEQESMFLLINPKRVANMRKVLKDELKYVEGFVRTGYIGTLAGVPVITSKAVPEYVGYLATKEAITLFIKKGSEVAQERDENLRKNTVYARKVALVALTNATKLVRIAQTETTAPTIVTYLKNDATIAGTCAAGSVVKVYNNGVLVGTATVTSTNWTIEAAANLAPADVITITSRRSGYITATATATVAA